MKKMTWIMALFTLMFMVAFSWNLMFFFHVCFNDENVKDLPFYQENCNQDELAIVNSIHLLFGELVPCVLLMCLHRSNLAAVERQRTVEQISF